MMWPFPKKEKCLLCRGSVEHQRHVLRYKCKGVDDESFAEHDAYICGPCADKLDAETIPNPDALRSSDDL